MKFATASIFSLLAISASLVAGQNCDICKQTDKLTKCTQQWVDAVNACMNSSCNYYTQNPIFSCTQLVNDQPSTGAVPTKTTTVAITTTASNGSKTSVSTSTNGSAVTTATANGSAPTGNVMGVIGMAAAVGLSGLALL